MEIFEYLFIVCCVIVVFGLLVLIIRPFIPKYMMVDSKDISIKRGKIIGSIIGFVIGVFLCYYLWVNYFYVYFL